MKLTIVSVNQNDFGSYRCVSKNSLGDTDGSIKLYRKWTFIWSLALTQSLCSLCLLGDHRSILLICLNFSFSIFAFLAFYYSFLIWNEIIKLYFYGNSAQFWLLSVFTSLYFYTWLAFIAFGKSKCFQQPLQFELCWTYHQIKRERERESGESRDCVHIYWGEEKHKTFEQAFISSYVSIYILVRLSFLQMSILLLSRIRG